MIIHLKNKQTLKIGNFYFKCSIGASGFTEKKIEGDKKTPKGIFSIEHLYVRKDRIKQIHSKLKIISIKKNMGWCDDVLSKKYNKLIKIKKKIKHEKLKRKDYKYDLLIPILYNYFNTKKYRGSAIFLHLTKKYLPTNGCIGLIEKDFKILLKLIKKDTKILIKN